MAYKYFKIKKNELCITFIILALLFQPFVRIPLGRKIWNIIDVAVATFLIILFLVEYYKNKKNEYSQKKGNLTFCNIHGAGTITCTDCGMQTEVTVFMHGPYSCEIGRQCQSCGTFFTEHNESKIYHTFGPQTKKTQYVLNVGQLILEMENCINVKIHHYSAPNVKVEIYNIKWK